MTLRSQPRRDAALDGLRGVAALVVVCTHVLLASVPKLADGYLSGGTPVAEPKLAAALLYTPLHVFWAGREWVIVFFVLSGFVLALPVVRERPYRWASYYPHRLLRLYLPVWGALCLGLAVHLLVEGRHDSGTWWLAAHTLPLTGHDAVESILLLAGAGTFSLLGVLWSLHFEVVFSLLLPVFLVVASAVRRFVWAGVALALLVIFFRDGSGAAQYLPACLLGTLLAFQEERIAALRRRLAPRNRRTAAVKVGMLVGAVLGLTADWWLRLDGWVLTAHHSAAAQRIAPVLIACGACLALLLPLLVSSTRRVLESPPLHWTGTRSYSLYLVHEPIVVLVAFVLGARPSPIVLALVAVPAALLVTEAFFRAVERPSHRLARRAGRAAGRLAVRMRGRQPA